MTGDQPVDLQDIEVVGEQVRLHSEHPAQFDRGPVRHAELVDDRQPDRITQRRVPSRSHFNLVGLAHDDISISNY